MGKHTHTDRQWHNDKDGTMISISESIVRVRVLCAQYCAEQRREEREKGSTFIPVPLSSVSVSLFV